MHRRASAIPCLYASALMLGGCDSPTSAPQVSAAASAAIGISTDILTLRSQLRAARSATTDPAKSIALEAVMSVLASGVRLTLADLALDRGSDEAKSGLFLALNTELTAAADSSLLASLGANLEITTRASLISLQGRVRAIQRTLMPGAPATAAQPAAWAPIWSRELDYATGMRSAGNLLLSSVQSCSARNVQVRAVAPSIERVFALHAGYLEQMARMTAKTTVDSDDWARQRALAARMDALTQLLAAWLSSDPVVACGLPPEPMLTYDGGPGDKCIKMSVGNEAGTLGGPISSNVKSPCPILAGPVVVVPMPTP